MGFLDGQTGIVTGAAVGLGNQYARALAQEGCNVVVCDIRPEIHELAESLQKLGVGAKAYIADVSKPSDVRRVVDGAIDAFGRVDVLINNAGIVKVTLATDDLDKSLQDYDDLVTTNFKGEFMFGRAVIPHMIRQGGGNIINIATDHVHTHPGRPTAGGTMMDLYDASKWGVLGLTIAWAKALKDRNIRVNAFSMGATDSHMIRGFVGDAVTPEMIATWMRPEEVCDLAIQLIREGPSGRTAENIGVWVDFKIELKANPASKPLTASA